MGALPCDNHRRLLIPAQPSPKQDPATRVHNWEEVYLPLDLETARREAERCLHCPDAPCQQACPLHNSIPEALYLLEQGDVLGAAQTFRRTSNFPEMCGRLCPQEALCEGACVVGFAIRPASLGPQPPVQIGRLEAFVADYQRQLLGRWPPVEQAPPTGYAVAVVGSGPAGLVCAEELAKLGHAVTVYEAWPRPGGVLRYGIPNFKMRKEILDAYIAHLESLGIRFVCNTFIGQHLTVDDLFQAGYHAIFLAPGAPVGVRLNIPGEELAGVFAATEFLVRGNLAPEELPPSMRQPLRVGRHVVVIGGGDTSMDCVRTAIRLGAESVTLVYRRTEAEMMGREEERRHAREEGVRFLFLAAPTRFIGEEGRVVAVELQRMELGPPDASGRRRPVPIPGALFTLPADTAVVAVGYEGEEEVIRAAPGVRKGGKNLIRLREGFQTHRPGVFAGGDSIKGADLVVTAAADGRQAAQAIHQYLLSQAKAVTAGQLQR